MWLVVGFPLDASSSVVFLVAFVFCNNLEAMKCSKNSPVDYTPKNEHDNGKFLPWVSEDAFLLLEIRAGWFTFRCKYIEVIAMAIFYG